jgi:hypothetical protein
MRNAQKFTERKIFAVGLVVRWPVYSGFRFVLFVGLSRYASGSDGANSVIGIPVK